MQKKYSLYPQDRNKDIHATNENSKLLFHLADLFRHYWRPQPATGRSTARWGSPTRCRCASPSTSSPPSPVTSPSRRQVAPTGTWCSSPYRSSGELPIQEFRWAHHTGVQVSSPYRSSGEFTIQEFRWAPHTGVQVSSPHSVLKEMSYHSNQPFWPIKHC